MSADRHIAGDHCRRESQMDVNFECRGIGNTIRILLTAVAALLVSAPVFAASKVEERAAKRAVRAATCTDTLKAGYGAIEFSDFSHSQNGHRSVHTTARLADGRTIRFRCALRLGVVSRVDVYEPANPAIVSSKAGWTSAEPYRVEPEPDADVPVETTPEQEPKKAEVPSDIEPEFKTPGTGTGFKTPGTGTGFKTPGTGTGSLFKPAK